MNHIETIKYIRARTNECILFHSATGKDSILLLDLLAKSFDKVVCVFMYMVDGLEYENKYIEYAEKKYDNVMFFKTPHFALYSFIKNGHLGIKKNISIPNMTISKIDKLVKCKFNIEYSFYGFKKVDGITRRMMLKDLHNNVSEKTKKAYPLANLTNNNVLDLINHFQLIQPFNYNKLKPSSGCDISDPIFLSYMEKKYPNDLRKIIDTFPSCEVILFKYNQYGKI